MHLVIPKADLTRALNAVSKVVEARSTMPILSSLLLTATDGKLTVTGTDLDITATATAAATVTKPGSVCVDAKLLASIAAKAAGDISLNLDADKLTVKSGRSRFSLATLPASDFPSMSAGTYDATFDIDLAALFAPVAFAIADKDNLAAFEGLYLHGDDAVITAVATNRHKLSRHVGESVGKFPPVVLTKKSVALIPKGVVSISVSAEAISVTQGDFTFTSKLIAAEYPAYERVIPMENKLVASVDRSEIMKAADRVTAVSSERGSAVKFSLVPGAISLTVNSQVGEASDELPAAYSGEPTEIGFNSVYFRDCVGVFPDGPVEIALNDNASPARITSPSYPALDVVIMPMRV